MNKKEQLLEAIVKYIHDLKNQDINKQEEAQFFKEFLKAYNINDFESYNNITNISYLMCIMMAEDIDIAFLDFMKFADDIQVFVDGTEVNLELYKKYLKSLKELHDLGIINKITDNKLVKNFKPKEIEAFTNYKKIAEQLFTFEDDNEVMMYHPEINNAFVELFKVLPKPDKYECFLDLAVASAIVQSLINDIYNDVYDGVRDLMALGDDNLENRVINKTLKKEKSKILEFVRKEFFEEEIGQKIKKDYEYLVNYSSSLQKQVKDEVSSINRRIKKLDTLIYKIKYLNKKDIINIDNYNEFLFDSHIKELFIQFALEHNISIYKNTEEKNREYKNNKINKVEMLFNKYGFEFNNLLIEEQELIIKESENKNIENILGIIKYSDLAFLTEYHKEFTKILLEADVEIIKSIDCALKNKIIDKNFIINNMELLFDKDLYLNFTENINLLTINKIELTEITKFNSQLLLINNDVLKLVFNILKEYNFNLNQDNNLEILINSNLLDIIDNFIELGMGNVIKNSQKHLTNKAYNIVKRILISNLVGLNSLNNSNKLVGQVATGNKFYIIPDKYDNYIVQEEECYLNPNCVNVLKNNNRLIISDDTKNDAVIATLDEHYRKSSLTYEIAGVIISRNRVLRNFEILKQNSDISITDVLYQAIIYKIIGNIDDEKLVEIYNSLKSLNLEKTKIYER